MILGFSVSDCTVAVHTGDMEFNLIWGKLISFNNFLTCISDKHWILEIRMYHSIDGL